MPVQNVEVVIVHQIRCIKHLRWLRRNVARFDGIGHGRLVLAVEDVERVLEAFLGSRSFVLEAQDLPVRAFGEERLCQVHLVLFVWAIGVGGSAIVFLHNVVVAKLHIHGSSVRNESVALDWFVSVIYKKLCDKKA